MAVSSDLANDCATELVVPPPPRPLGCGYVGGAERLSCSDDDELERGVDPP